jgi:hypothetical protein
MRRPVVILEDGNWRNYTGFVNNKYWPPMIAYEVVRIEPK